MQSVLSGRGLSFLAFCCGFAPLAVGNRIINRFFSQKIGLGLQQVERVERRNDVFDLHGCGVVCND